jgi:hypothetical protein
MNFYIRQGTTALILLCSIILGKAEVKEIDCENVDWILLD